MFLQTCRLSLLKFARVKYSFTSLNSSTTAAHTVQEHPELVHDLLSTLNSLSTYEGCKFRHPLMTLPLQHKLVLIEFSSPNIAKPLHAGHLRSTVIGNVLANLYAASGHSAFRVNYLGDCGTQFALIGSALEPSDIADLRKKANNDKSNREVMSRLMDLYVAQSKKFTELSGAEFSSFKNSVDQWHKKFEEGDQDIRHVWRLIKKQSLDNLVAVYERLGLHFDRYEYESDYIQLAHIIGEKLLAGQCHRLEATRPDNTMGCFVNLKGSPRSRVFLKSDGTSVYLSRDVAALLERVDHPYFGHNFDHVHYVVENGQSDQLEAVRQISLAIRPEQHDCLHRDKFHVKFGRIHGMSTRSGSVVLLSDILDESRLRMIDILRKKSTTKIDLDDNSAIEAVAERLGVTAVVFNDLKRKRQGDYDFSWDATLNFGSGGGISLQYTHARLCSIESQACLVLRNNDRFSCEKLLENENACRLLNHMLSFENTVTYCLDRLETSPFAKFSTQLAKLSNRCVEDSSLRVKNQEESVALPRFLLFKSARNLLASCLNIMGLPALPQI